MYWLMAEWNWNEPGFDSHVGSYDDYLTAIDSGNSIKHKCRRVWITVYDDTQKEHKLFRRIKPAGL